MKCYSSITGLFPTLFASAVLSLAAETKDCGIINSVQFGNNEKFTQIDEFPWLARIAHKITENLEIIFRCHAVLISQQYLITVANCIQERADIEPYAVLLGDWDSSNSYSEKDCDSDSGKCSTPLLIEIDELITYPYFNDKKMQNNIGLLHLIQAVTYTDFIRPICLPSKDVQNKEFLSEELVLTGWLRRVEGHKRKFPVVVFSQHECSKTLGSQINITDSLICGNTCVEHVVDILDSVMCENSCGAHYGSALMDVKKYKSSPTRKVYLVGILAYTTWSCRNRVPDVLTRIDKYLDWINENIS